MGIKLGKVAAFGLLATLLAIGKKFLIVLVAVPLLALRRLFRRRAVGRNSAQRVLRLLPRGDRYASRRITRRALIRPTELPCPTIADGWSREEPGSSPSRCRIVARLCSPTTSMRCAMRCAGRSNTTHWHRRLRRLARAPARHLDVAGRRHGFLHALAHDQDALRPLHPQNEPLTVSRVERGERGIWQRRFWEHHIRNDDEFGHYADYCAINPVKHGLVRRPIEWPYSSFHRDLRRGIYSEDWGTRVDVPGEFGEPA